MASDIPTPTFTDDLDQILIISARPHPKSGFSADSDTALVWLTPILGPTSTLVLHRASRYLTEAETVVFTTGEFAASFGVTASKLRYAIERLVKFGFADRVGDRIEVATVVELTSKQIARLPQYLQAAPREH